MIRAVVGLGANLGSRAAFLLSALDLLGVTPGIRLEAVSPAYVTEALEGKGPPYLNGAARVGTDLPLHRLLDRLLRIERDLGRVRGGRYSPRTLDLDLLWASEPVHDPPRLLVPHSCLTERSFALAPLLDVAPDLEDQYAAALRATGGRPPDARPLEDRSDHDDWDRMAAELGRRARRDGGPVPDVLEVHGFAVAPPGLPAGFDEAERRLGELVRSPWGVARVALGPAGDGGASVYVVGGPRGWDRP